MNTGKDKYDKTDEPMLIERHPWPPFIPPKARILIMGTFPPGAHRHSMDFYYPNRINDFWRIMGLIFYGEPNALWMNEEKKFNLPKIKEMLTAHGIAMNDTGREVRRLRGNASDKFLEIVTPVPLAELLGDMPQCNTVATTGEKAASVIAEITSTPLPKMGECITTEFAGRKLNIWRMPSTSRAYPMKLEKKAEYYREMFIKAGVYTPTP